MNKHSLTTLGFFMHSLSFFLLLVFSTSCILKGKEDKDSSPTVEMPSEQIFKIPNGVYRSPNLLNGSLKYTVTIEVTDDVLRERYTLHSTTAYTTAWWYYDTYYKIDKSIYDGDSTEDVLIDLSVTSVKYKWNHAWYPQQHYCGITNWNTTSEREMAGVHCPDHAKLSTCTTHSSTTISLTDREDKTIRAVGHKVYIKAKYFEDTSLIKFPGNNPTKGDDPLQRFGIEGDEDDIYELNKVP